MKIWYNNIFESQRYIAEVVGTRVRVGRASGNDIVLNSPFVADEAVVLDRSGDSWEVISLGLNGCEVDGRQLRPGERISVTPQQPIKVFPFTLTLDAPRANDDSRDTWRADLDRQMSDAIRCVHLKLLPVMDLDATDDPRIESEEYLMTLERNLEEIARLNGVTVPTNHALLSHLAGYAVRSQLIEQLIDQSEQENKSILQPTAHWTRLVSAHPERESDLQGLVNNMRTTLGLNEIRDLSRQMETVELRFWDEWQLVNAELFDELRLYLALRQLKKQIKDIVFGYGPLEDLIRAPNVTEIMVVSRDRIYIERGGVVENSGRQFISDEVTLTIIERIVSKVGRRIDKSQPLVDARLTDGSRVNAVIPPLAVSGPCLTIRKFPAKRLTVDDLIAKGSITPVVADFLRAAVRAQKNILIAGGTGTGKTTLLNCLAEFIPEKERIVTIEDTAELQLHKDHVVRIETKQANAEGAGAYTIHDLVKNALRMRPDRIVVGECRGPEALDMLQAMNTGHDGSMTTIHANNAQDVILRLEVLVQSAAPLPIQSIHRQIASAIDLVVQLSRLSDGRRVISQVTEIVDAEEIGESLRLKDLFWLEDCGGTLQICPTGYLPTFMPELIQQDLISLDSFYR